MQIKLSKQAQFDLDNIFVYSLENWGEVQAIKYLKNLQKQINLITTFKYLGRSLYASNPNEFRSLLYKQHSIFYFIDEDFIIIITVLNSRQNRD